MKRELALRIVGLNEKIQEAEYEVSATKETIKEWKEAREAFLRELVMLVTEGEE